MKKNSIAFKFPGSFEEQRFEKLHNVVFESSFSGSKEVANEIASLIKQKQKTGENCVLGLATGSSPLSVYKALIKLHQEEGLSF